MEGQRRGRRIAMMPDELDAFLQDERVCRVATIGVDGSPHNTPLWFVWDGAALWLNSVVRSQRWGDLQRDPRVSVVIDAGRDYRELRGVEVRGQANSVGDAPRGAVPDAVLAVPESLFAQKYQGGSRFEPDGRHGWLRVEPTRMVSWDFRKLADPARRGGDTS